MFALYHLLGQYSALPLAMAACLIQYETGYEEDRPGTQLQLRRHYKIQMSGLQLRAGLAIFKVNLV